jgi:hypothetical protein
MTTPKEFVERIRAAVADVVVVAVPEVASGICCRTRA